MDKLLDRISEKMADSLGYDDEKKAVVKYGLVILIQGILIFAVVGILSALFRFFFESVIILVGSALLRKNSGGAHSSTLEGCLVISCTVVILLGAVSKYVFSAIDTSILLMILVAFGILSFILVLLLAPVESPNKPLKNKPEKVKRLRIQSLAVVVIVAALSIITALLFPGEKSLAAAASISILWQSLTLTAPVRFITVRFDSLFHKIRSND